jgi:hypothetical protein
MNLSLYKNFPLSIFFIENAKTVDIVDSALESRRNPHVFLTKSVTLAKMRVDIVDTTPPPPF